MINSSTPTPLGELEHTLVILGEECMEVAHRVAKALRFGLAECNPADPTKNNAYLIGEEFAQLLAVYARLSAAGMVPDQTTEAMTTAREKKFAKMEEYMEYSVRCGTLVPPAE
jgi:hypothetical protein